MFLQGREEVRFPRKCMNKHVNSLLSFPKQNGNLQCGERYLQKSPFVYFKIILYIHLRYDDRLFFTDLLLKSVAKFLLISVQKSNLSAQLEMCTLLVCLLIRKTGSSSELRQTAMERGRGFYYC